MLGSRRKGLDQPLIVLTAVLIFLGLMTLFSAGQTDFPTVATGIWVRQITWIGLGVIGATVVFRVPATILEWLTPFIYILAIGLLLLTLVVGTGAGTAASSKSWLSIGSVRIGQPAEFAKLATILMLARHFGSKRHSPQSMFALGPAGIIVGIPFLLVGLQPDLGSALVFLGIFFFVSFWVGVNPWIILLIASPVVSLILTFSTRLWGAWIVGITLLLVWLRPFLFEAATVWTSNVLAGVVAPRLWAGLAPYQKNRILSFLDPEVDPRATGWNIIQAKVAIGSGGLLGKGFTEGTQKRLAFLPAQHTDFIFPVLAEEFGFVGVLFVISLLVIFFLTLIRIARHAVDPFATVVAAGVIGLFMTHVFENIGMSVGLLPVTGIPLPFFSYGGSFMMISLICMGMMLRIAWDARYKGYLQG